MLVNNSFFLRGVDTLVNIPLSLSWLIPGVVVQTWIMWPSATSVELRSLPQQTSGYMSDLTVEEVSKV